MDIKLARQAKKSRIRARIRNFIWLLTKLFRKGILLATGIGGVQTMEGSLDVRVRRNGIWYDFGNVGHKLITTAFAEFIVDQLIAETSAFGDLKYHEIGTSSQAENKTDTALISYVEGRVAGTQVEDSSKVYKSVAIHTLTADRTITEHGIFNHVTHGSGTMADRTVFTGVALLNGDGFESTYKLTVNDNT